MHWRLHAKRRLVCVHSLIDATQDLNQYRSHQVEVSSCSGHQHRRLNRPEASIPRDSVRPLCGVDYSRYICAFLCDGYSRRDALIMAQAPLKATVGDFWSMLCFNQCRIVVQLNRRGTYAPDYFEDLVCGVTD